MKLFNTKKAADEAEEDFRRRLFEDIDFVTERLRQIRESYDMTAEPELVDALIYEELAMKARLDFLIRTAKERKITCRIALSE